MQRELISQNFIEEIDFFFVKLLQKLKLLENFVKNLKYYLFVISNISESFDESSNMRPLRSTSTGGGIGNDFDTSFDASDIIPNLNNGRSASSMDDDDDVVHILQGGKSPLPPSEAQDRLDNSLRYDLKYKKSTPPGLVFVGKK